jgi:hypothetical protein
MSRIVECVRDLEVYKAAFEIQQKVFRASKTWPFEKQKVKSRKQKWTSGLRACLKCPTKPVGDANVTFQAASKEQGLRARRGTEVAGRAVGWSNQDRLASISADQRFRVRSGRCVGEVEDSSSKIGSEIEVRP